jgi:hypothetical protein
MLALDSGLSTGSGTGASSTARRRTVLDRRRSIARLRAMRTSHATGGPSDTL